MGSQSEEMIHAHNEEEQRETEVIDFCANSLADKFKDSSELAHIADKRLIVIAYWAGYNHGKSITKHNLAVLDIKPEEMGKTK